ncbi:hypothetical protein HNR61_001250 [Actinomadura namibiensis]|uniref:Uncharacterized protein n=1 Tax=Actinomadura namibiensis TaxID=182080 RepID=A0A7W3LKB3_ACTNM|nr:hypothetical protein [Actinomadura namibiensis]
MHRAAAPCPPHPRALPRRRRRSARLRPFHPPTRSTDRSSPVSRTRRPGPQQAQQRRTRQRPTPRPPVQHARRPNNSTSPAPQGVPNRLAQARRQDPAAARNGTVGHSQASGEGTTPQAPAKGARIPRTRADRAAPKKSHNTHSHPSTRHGGMAGTAGPSRDHVVGSGTAGRRPFPVVPVTRRRGWSRGGGVVLWSGCRNVSWGGDRGAAFRVVRSQSRSCPAGWGEAAEKLVTGVDGSQRRNARGPRGRAPAGALRRGRDRERGPAACR